MKTRYAVNRSIFLSESIFAIALVGVAIAQPASTQPIIAEPNGTGTLVTPAGDQFEISGGALSGDNANLFHSFAQFNLNANQVANFLSNPQIQNILTRVVGNDPSMINGLIQVSGSDANLYLMNPNGIIFGRGASLNVGGDFFATTATGIGFDNGWFNAFGDNNYETLLGNPNQFAFDLSNVGAIVNEGSLIVERGRDITLLGGTIVNAGTVTTTGGRIRVTPVADSHLIRISQPGNVLSLEIEPPRDSNGLILNFNPLDLPELLTGSGVQTGLTINPDNTVQTALGISLPIQASFGDRFERGSHRPSTVVVLVNAVFTLSKPQPDPTEPNPQFQAEPTLIQPVPDLEPIAQPQLSTPVVQVLNPTPHSPDPNLNTIQDVNRTTDSASQMLNCTQVHSGERNLDIDLNENENCRFSEEDEEVPILDTSEVLLPENAP